MRHGVISQISEHVPPCCHRGANTHGTQHQLTHTPHQFTYMQQQQHQHHHRTCILSKHGVGRPTDEALTLYWCQISERHIRCEDTLESPQRQSQHWQGQAAIAHHLTTWSHQHNALTQQQGVPDDVTCQSRGVLTVTITICHMHITCRHASASSSYHSSITSCLKASTRSVSDAPGKGSSIDDGMLRMK